MGRCRLADNQHGAERDGDREHDTYIHSHGSPLRNGMTATSVLGTMRCPATSCDIRVGWLPTSSNRPRVAFWYRMRHKRSGHRAQQPSPCLTVVALPTTSATGTGPRNRLSCELVRLSP